MKKGSEGTRKSYTSVSFSDDVPSSSYGPEMDVVSVPVTNPEDMPQASISFSVNARDANTLELLQDLYEREGYDYYAERIEGYK